MAPSLAGTGRVRRALAKIASPQGAPTRGAKGRMGHARPVNCRVLAIPGDAQDDSVSGGSSSSAAVMLRAGSILGKHEHKMLSHCARTGENGNMNAMLKSTRSISRRHFARLAAAGAAIAAARPAIAQQTSETVKWRLTSSFPKNL